MIAPRHVAEVFVKSRIKALQEFDGHRLQAGTKPRPFSKQHQPRDVRRKVLVQLSSSCCGAPAEWILANTLFRRIPDLMCPK
jgi:hypothetical protein